MFDVVVTLFLTLGGACNDTGFIGSSSSIGPAKQALPPVANQRVVRRLTVRNVRNPVTITFEAKPFMPLKHRIQKGGQRTNSGYASPFMIDGTKAWGCDSGGGPPKFQLDRVAVQFGKNRVIVPKKLVTDCFEPHLEDTEYAGRRTRFVEARALSRDRVLLGLLGSDGGGGYAVLWTVTSTGRVSRKIGGEELVHEFDSVFRR